jgi:hypothetical protein
MRAATSACWLSLRGRRCRRSYYERGIWVVGSNGTEKMTFTGTGSYQGFRRTAGTGVPEGNSTTRLVDVVFSKHGSTPATLANLVPDLVKSRDGDLPAYSTTQFCDNV